MQARLYHARLSINLSYPEHIAREHHEARTKHADAQNSLPEWARQPFPAFSHSPAAEAFVDRELPRAREEFIRKLKKLGFSADDKISVEIVYGLTSAKLSVFAIR